MSYLMNPVPNTAASPQLKQKFRPKTKAMLRCPTCHCQKVLPTGRTSYAEIGEWDTVHQCYEETKELTEHKCTACEKRFYI